MSNYRSILTYEGDIIIVYELYFDGTNFVEKRTDDCKIYYLHIRVILDKHKYFTNRINLKNHKIEIMIIRSKDVIDYVYDYDEFKLSIEYELLRDNILKTLTKIQRSFMCSNCGSITISVTNKLKDYLDA